MKQPLEFEIRDYLKENATDIGGGLWLIEGRACPDRMARDLAELALITGQKLTVSPSLLGTLNLARRVCALELAVDRITDKVRL